MAASWGLSGGFIDGPHFWAKWTFDLDIMGVRYVQYSSIILAVRPLAKASKPDNSDVTVAIVVSTVARLEEVVKIVLQSPKSEIMHNI